VYISENGSKYAAESSIPSDRGGGGAVATNSEANIEASPIRQIDTDQPYTAQDHQ
jgi:hypothetical protein